MTQASYDPHRQFGGVQGELYRLKIQAELSWVEESRLLGQIGVHNGQRILELGSGPGYVTEQLLSLLPDSLLTAIEIRSDMLDIAQHQNISYSPRLTLIQGSASTLPLADNSFDVAIARFLLQHLETPQLLMREVHRVLKPGGKLVIIDVDGGLWGIVQPYQPTLHKIYAKADIEQVHNGGNRLIGRQLWRLLAETGYSNPQLDLFAYHSDQLGIQAFDAQLTTERLLPAVSAGNLSLQEYLTAVAAYQEFLKTPDAYIMMVGFLAHGIKPD
jgi:ubiquinone/menaquinone biosynthesis C-methylase UbiE